MPGSGPDQGAEKPGEISWREKGLPTPEVVNESKHIRTVPMVSYRMGHVAKKF